LIIIDYKADEIIKIQNLQSEKLVKSFGRRGQGPSEFIGASDIIPSPNEKNTFWIYDISARNLKKFNLDAVFGDNFYPENIINIKGVNGTPRHLRITPYNEIFGVGLFLESRIEIYNMNGDFIRSIGKVPVALDNKRFASQHSHGFTGKFVFKNESNEVFIATRHGSLIEKYNAENAELTSTFIGPDPFFPAYKIVSTGEFYTMTYTKKTRFGYLDILYNKNLDRLFLLYSGEYQYNKYKTDAHLGNTLYVIDAKGAIVIEIELDKKILQIAISDDGSTLFGISRTEILKFNIANNIGI